MQVLINRQRGRAACSIRVSRIVRAAPHSLIKTRPQVTNRVFGLQRKTAAIVCLWREVNAKLTAGKLGLLRFVRGGGRFVRVFFSISTLAFVIGLSVSLAGCAANDPELMTSSLTDTSIPASFKLVEQAKLQFADGNYGSAVDAYAKTIEKDPLNADAWLGLAAAYDQIGRFDEADKAYSKVQELIGATPSVLNNLGYSYLLRGNLDRSRKTLEAAYKSDPSNPYILNNIDILNRRLATLGHSPLMLN